MDGEFNKDDTMDIARLASRFSNSKQTAEAMGYHTFPSISGAEIDTKQWQGKPFLVVNTASHCGFTKQYSELQKLYDTYRTQGFGLVAVPSGDFNQELGSDAEVQSFCEINYGLNIPMSSKLSVKGPKAHDFYKDVKTITGFAPNWNFNKVLIGSDGQVVDTWGSITKPMSAKITRLIERELSPSH